jgi:iron complex outermembrane receptor protein
VADGAERITITGSRSAQAATVAGWGDIPLAALPASATVITRQQLQDAGIDSLRDLTRLDAAIGDAYNAPGYVGQLQVRGFVLDNRYNLRRDGLPIQGETVFAQGNLQALELLKGTSGLQAGVSAPAGLLNQVVKRPGQAVREVSMAYQQPGSWETSVDIGQQVGPEGRIGWRLNLEGARLDPAGEASQGQRHLAALAVDVQAGRTLMEAEWEQQRQSQPSTPGFSLLGQQLPDARTVDPRLNLNNQSWSLPVVFAGQTGSVRITHALDGGDSLQVHAMQQRLATDDRVAFPFGCSAENAYDRYCSDGSYDFYDYRSENEQRRSRAWQLTWQGSRNWAAMAHRLSARWLDSRQSARFDGMAYNYVGTGQIDGTAQLTADPALTLPNTNRQEHSQEISLQDAISWHPRGTAWLGLRHTRLERASAGTDGSEPVDYRQAFTTPWLGLSWQLGALGGGVASNTRLYLSWGQGIESEATPNRPGYATPGEALAALRSRQMEAGVRHRDGRWELRAAVFDVRRPVWSDLLMSNGTPAASGCAEIDPCVREPDGHARHLGIEAEAEWQSGPWSLRTSALWLRARREGASDAALNGLTPTNVPAKSLKGQLAWNAPAMPGLTLLAFVNHEGRRWVLPDNSIATPGWTRLDLGARFSHRLQGGRWTWRLALENALNHRAWQESPYQYGHAYLYPMAARTWRASLHLSL